MKHNRSKAGKSATSKPEAQPQALFFKVLSTEPPSFVPVIHYPKRGPTRADLGNSYPRPAGIYLSIDQRGKVKDVLSSWPVKGVCFVCVRVGGRVSRVGAPGVDSIEIPITKPELCTVCPTAPPEGLLPLLLDCGTDDAELLADPLYPGLKHKRPATEHVDGFVAELARAARELHPACCVHFEDWKGMEASRLLKHYVDNVSRDKSGSWSFRRGGYRGT